MELSVAYLQYLNFFMQSYIPRITFMHVMKASPHWHLLFLPLCLCTTKITECLQGQTFIQKFVFPHFQTETKSWEEIKRFFSVSLCFYLIFYHLLLFIIFWVNVSLCKQLALQLRSLISPIIDLLPVLPESKSGSVSEHPVEDDVETFLGCIQENQQQLPVCVATK